MDDLISRQDAIDLLLDKGLITAAIYVERMPPVQPEIIEQIRWERDTAIQQLAELGYGLGEKQKKEV